MIGKLPNLNPQDMFHERAANQVHALTDIPVDICMRIVCELDDRPSVQALIDVLKTGINAQHLLNVYEMLSEIEMLRP